MLQTSQRAECDYGWQIDSVKFLGYDFFEDTCTK